MWTQTQLIQGFDRDLDPRLIDGGIQIGLAAKAGGRGRGPNVVEYRFVTVQRMTSPVGADQIEHPMLDQVPLGGPRRIVVDGDNQAEFIGQLLQFDPPQSGSIPIGTPTVGLDQQAALARIQHPPQVQPPRSDRRDRKLSRIMRRADDDIAQVMADVIDTVGNSFALGQTQKVVDMHLASLLAPLFAGLLKVADQLRLFRIDTDDRPVVTQVSLPIADQVAKLLIPVGRWFARYPFVIDPQRIILGLQQATDCRQTDRILARQGLLDFAQRLVRPFQPRNRVTGRLIGQQGFQGGQQSERFFSVRGRPAPLLRTRSVKSPAAISCWPRVIVVRLRPVIWARRVTPP